MWFDVRKLIANANFQDVPDVSAPIDPALAETPAAAPGGATVGGDPLMLGAGPAPAATTPPVDLGATSGFAGPSGDVFASPMDPGGTGFTDTSTAAPAADTSYGSTADTISKTSPAASTAPAAASTDPTYKAETTAIEGAGGARTPGAGGAGAAGAAPNAVQGFANALNGLARAAQGGNPQAAQLMNMIRQMMMQQQMAGMMGGGQGYNPYMNQMQNPWAARMRMEEMRRRFMERQRLARNMAEARGMGHPGGGTFGGGHGRR
jgi:hypothetical protein